MGSKKYFYILIPVFIGILFLLFFLPGEKKIIERTPFSVRVRLFHDIKKLDIRTVGAAHIIDLQTGKYLNGNFNENRSISLDAKDGNIILKDTGINTDRIRIMPAPGLCIIVNGTEYEGVIDIISGDKGFDVINRIDIEDYLKGVLPREIYPFWPYQSIKAQAVASRSFAVNEAIRRKDKEYDVTSDTFSQVYGGRSAYNGKINRAVEETAGEILTCNGKIMPGYFHSCCGGHTRDASLVWGNEMPALRGVPCRYCRWSPYFRWKVRIPSKDIVNKLRKKGYEVKNLKDIRPGKRRPSGYLEYVKIKDGRTWSDINVREFRNTIGRSLIKSANFRIKKYPRFYLFYGYGWGHGVGMCQWGAFYLGLRRWKADRILEFYYPGAKIGNLKDLIQ